MLKGKDIRAGMVILRYQRTTGGWVHDRHTVQKRDGSGWESKELRDGIHRTYAGSAIWYEVEDPPVDPVLGETCL